MLWALVIILPLVGIVTLTHQIRTGEMHTAMAMFPIKRRTTPELFWLVTIIQAFTMFCMWLVCLIGATYKM